LQPVSSSICPSFVRLFRTFDSLEIEEAENFKFGGDDIRHDTSNWGENYFVVNQNKNVKMIFMYIVVKSKSIYAKEERRSK